MLCALGLAVVSLLTATTKKPARFSRTSTAPTFIPVAGPMNPRNPPREPPVNPG